MAEWGMCNLREVWSLVMNLWLHVSFWYDNIQPWQSFSNETCLFLYVACSDNPGKHDFELLRTLVLPDGIILCANVPGKPPKISHWQSLDPLLEPARSICHACSKILDLLIIVLLHHKTPVQVYLQNSVRRRRKKWVPDFAQDRTWEVEEVEEREDGAKDFVLERVM